MKLATWNINSVRLRRPIVDRLIAEHAPDVICLQETKVQDADFPHAFFQERGYKHREIYGRKNWHGVAIVSRLPFSASGRRDWCDLSDGRHVHATIGDAGGEGIEVHSYYVPSGGDVPDPAQNEKFAHKLRFMTEQTDHWRELRDDNAKRVIVGDFNVAPLETDVWSHKQLLDVVSHTPIEVEHLAAWQDAGGWVDGVRRIIPPAEKIYSWWSYRAKDWRASNRGRRLDHVWVTPALAPALTGIEVLADARGWEKPSDHVPVIATFEV